MPLVMEYEITAHQEAARGHYRLVLHAPEIAETARPGQFCMLQVQQGYYPFLRRPMSIERIFADGISFLYKVEGEGTRLLSRLHPGESLNVQGPLGKPFPLDAGYDRHILVAGGIGVAPFPALAEAILRELGKTPEVILAARSEEMLLCEKDFRQMGCAVHLATDDGSRGAKGVCFGGVGEVGAGGRRGGLCLRTHADDEGHALGLRGFGRSVLRFSRSGNGLWRRGMSGLRGGSQGGNRGRAYGARV